MINKRNLYAILATVIIIGFFNVLYINSLNHKINELEIIQDQLQTELTDKNNQIETINEQKKSLENIIENLETTLSVSQLNSSKLKTETRNLISNIAILEKDIQLLEEAIDIIGTGELGTVLKAYGETVKQLEDLQHEYARLKRDYDNLLAQQ